MNRNLTLARPFLVLALILGAIRFSFAPFGVPYESGRAQAVSLVMLTLLGSALYGAFSRRWLRFSLARAMGLGLTLGVIAQLVILVATLVSFAAGVTTFFNHPQALVGQNDPVSIGVALGARAGGLVVNSILASIAGAIGWVLGALLPQE
jgi:hypothetical protein